jgi:hypothetical protein
MINSRSLERRMARLETVFRPVLRLPPTEADLVFASALGKLLETMDQKHARIVRDEVASLRDPTKTPGARFSDLTVATILYVEGHIRDGLPLALPPAVAQVYLDDSGLVAIHDCEDCGYEVPIGYAEPQASPPKPVRIYFDRCPLCGGKTGYYAFYQRNARLKKASGSAASEHACT